MLIRAVVFKGKEQCKVYMGTEFFEIYTHTHTHTHIYIYHEPR